MTASLFPNTCWSLVIFWKSTCQSGISSDSRWQEWPVSVPVAFFFLCLFLFFCFSVTSCLILKSSSPGVFTSCQILHVSAACILLLSLLPHAFLPHARKRCHKSGFFDRTCGLTLDLFVLTWQPGWSPMDGAATYAQRGHLYTCWKQMPQAKILLFPSAVIIIGACLCSGTSVLFLHQ